MVPRTEPPVATWGLPLRDLEVSPRLGVSQFWGVGVVEKGRVVGMRVRRVDWRPGGG